ncbi:MAG TPA: ABC transporter ATP-binding protein [Thermoleophilaceae bacterium]|jgi:putative ABC transport system ATP-binding protein|nr:ABC transporter ATP-binding protein [Thermoleophilaceae bacterium]
MEVLYELDGVRKVFDGARPVSAVDGVDLEIRRGEYMSVVGASGSGKTTLLQLLGTLDRPSGGTLQFEGRDISRLSDSELADLRQKTLGFIFQQFNLIPTLTARQNVEAALAPSGMPAADRRERACDLLDRVGLGGRTDHVPSQLSGGEQQRVAIARALANEPDVLLADEPTGNLDSATSQEIIDLLRRLSRTEGLSIVLVTHDPQIAAGADRVVRMSDGRVVEDTRVAA